MFSYKPSSLRHLWCVAALALAACSPQDESLLLSFPTDTPTGLTAVADDRDITISWNAVETADSYALFRYTNSNCAAIPANFAGCENAFLWSGITATVVQDTNLANDQIYYYKVIAQSGDGDSTLSDQVSARTAPATAPPAPANISWDFINATALQFTWDAHQYADYYVVYRVTDATALGCSIPSSTANCGDDSEATQSEHVSTDSAWTDTSFTAGRNYDYVIVAFNDYGSTSSNSNTIHTIAEPPAISATSLSNSGLNLEWTSVTGADYYEVFRYTEPGCLSDDNADTFTTICANAIRVSNLTRTEYLDTLVGIDTASIYYRLRSINASGASYLSTESQLDLGLLAPDEFNLSTSSIGDTNYLQWSPVLLAESYTLYRYQDATCDAQPELCANLLTVDLTQETLDYTDDDIYLGENYYYNLRASNSFIGLGDLSSTIDSISAPTAATNLQAAAGDGEIHLTWDEHNNSIETVYNIYRSTCIPDYDDCHNDYGLIVQFSVGSRADGANSFTDSGLAISEKYYYIVSAEAGEWEINSSVVSATTNPTTISSFTANATGSHSVQLDWAILEDHQDDANHRVYVFPCDPSSIDCVPTSVEFGTGNIYSYTVEGLTAGKSYYFRLGIYTESVEINSTTVGAYTVVNQPYAINYESSIDSATISWSTDNGSDTQYALEAYLCADTGFDCVWDSSVAEPTYSTSITYGSLYSGSTYEIRINASAGEYTAASDTQTIYTLPIAADVSTDKFAVSDIQQNSISLSWDTSINGSSSNYIPIRYFCDLSAEEQCSGLHLATFNVLTDSFTDSELRAGSVYSYKLRSLNDTLAVDSEYIVVITTPSTQDDINAVAGDNNISLNWDMADADYYEYDVYQSELECFANQVLENNTLACGDITVLRQVATGVVFSDLLPATNYHYRVVVRNTINGTYSISEQVTAGTLPHVPEAVNWSSDTSTITITWDIGDNGELAIWQIYRYPCDPENSSCFDAPYTINLDYANASYQDAHDLIQGQEYFYIVSAIASNKESVSDSIIAMLQPQSTSDLSLSVGATSASNTAYTAAQAGLYIKLDWSANGNAADTNYTIYRRDCSSSENCPNYQFGSYSGIEDYSVTHTYDEQDNSGTVRELIPAQKYYYTVASSITSSNGAYLENNYTASAITYPAVVQELSASSISSNAIDVNWSAGDNGDEISYSASAYYCTEADGNGCSLYGNYFDLTDANRSIDELLSASHYAFTVTALAGDGSAASALLTGAATQPVALEDVSIKTYEQLDKAVIEASWTSDNGTAASYRRYLYECISASTCTLLSDEVGELDDGYSLSGGVYTWIDDNLDLGRAYIVIIGVESGGVELVTEAQNAVTPPPASTDLIASVSNGSEVELRWSNSNNDFVSSISYTAYAFRNACSVQQLIEDLENNRDDSCAIVEQGTSTSRSYDFISLDSGNTYFFAVLASGTSGDNWVADEDIIAFTIQPQAPLDLSISNVSRDGFQISFNAAANGEDTSYRVYLAECDNLSNCEAYSATDLPNGELTLTYNGLISGQHYSILASAIATDSELNIMESNSSSLSPITYPEAVTDLTAIGQDHSSIDLSFTSTNGSATTYIAYRHNCGYDPDDCSSVGVDSSIELSTSVSHTDNDSINPATYYAYTIGANAGDQEANSTTATPALTAPTALSIDSVTAGRTQLTVSYSEPSGAFDYYYMILSELECSDAAIAAGDSNECGNIIFSETNATTPVVFSNLAVGSTYYLRSEISNATGTAYSELRTEHTLSAYTSLDEPLADQQWHLVNNGSNSAFASDVGVPDIDINYTGALDMELTGAGVRVNVIDTGLEMQHPDMLANILAGGSYDFVEEDNDPTNISDTNGDHGTSVAGIIGAAVNGVGGAGIAPNVYLQAFNFLKQQSSANFVASIGGDAKLDDTAIFNKSFGTAEQYDSRYQSSYLDALSCFASGGAFDLASDSSCTGALRSSLGAIYVKSAGNGFASANDDAWCRNAEINLTCYNSNMDSSRTYPYQIVVGALNASGVKSSYANAGSSLWLTAPGGEYGYNIEHMSDKSESDLDRSILGDEYWQPAIITTDQVGCERGYSTYEQAISDTVSVTVNPLQEDNELNSNCEYTATFNGASAATPVVSGVVALMLEANPDLSWRDVKHILASTARQVDTDITAHSVPYMECADSGCSAYTASDSPSFTARDAWISNAAGYNFHSWYGFGLVNAGAAAAMALNYTSELGEWDMTSVDLSSINATIPDANGSAASTDFTVAEGLTIEAVQLDLQIAHHYLSALAVVLKSPNGTRSVLLTPYNQYDDKDFDSTLLSNAFYGEPAAGDWTLEVHDLIQDADDVVLGTLNRATLKIYGHLQN